MTAASVRPHSPPAAFDDLAPIGGQLGSEPEDFVVDELPLYPPSGSGHHRYVRMRKRCWTTPSMVSALARAAGVDARDIGYAGMKDRHAITTQWVSLPAASRPPETWELPAGLDVLEHTLHDNKLRTGHLRANRFVLRLVDVQPQGASHLDAWRSRLTDPGFPNYFGAQRFGRDGGNLARALDRVGSGSAADGSQRERPGRRRRSHFDDKLYSSVLQAEVFNRYLSARHAVGLDRLLMGEVVRLHNSTSVFVVEDPEAELGRWLSGDIHLTGPLPGPKMRQPSGDAELLERRVLAELGLTPGAIEKLGRSAPGTRRDLLARPESLGLEPLSPTTLRLEFVLPSGAYATELVRQLTGLAWEAVKPEIGSRGKAEPSSI